MSEMKLSDWRLTGFWIGMVMAGLIAGFVFGWCWRDRPGALASVSLLNVMTALGTLGATFVAVGIAAWQFRNAEQEKYLDAVHTAARIYARLASLAGDAAAFEEELKVASVVDIGQKRYNEIASNLHATWGSYSLPDPKVLIPIGRAYGLALASAIAHFELAMDLVQRAKSDADSPDGSDVRRMCAKTAVNALIPARELLSTVSEKCHAVASQTMSTRP